MRYKPLALVEFVHSMLQCPTLSSPKICCALSDMFIIMLQDLPSFTQDIQRMVNDLRYYAIVNASLPPGTIDLSQKEPEPISEY